MQDGERRLLIDTPPELRLQLVRAGIPSIDAVWYTHCHADHTHGVDDLRVFSVRQGGPLEVFADPSCAAVLARKFDYVFDPEMKPLEGTTKPEATLRGYTDYQPVDAGGFEVLPLPVPHGPIQVHGLRIGALGYITDAKRLPERTLEALRGVRVLVLNALWIGNPHPTHFNVEEAVEVAREVAAERTFLTHLSHRVSHRELDDILPERVHPAYDGLVVEV